MRDKICGIYCIENKINHKKYIGQSRDIFKRLSQHKRLLKKNCHSNRHLNDSFNIYGEDMFDFFVLKECLEEKLDDLEKYYISSYKTTDNYFGYNMLTGGGGTSGRIVSEETRKKLSISGQGRIFSKERNIKISKSKTGVPRNILPEHRLKMVLACIGNKIKTRKTSSKYRGVCFSKRDCVWRVNYRGSGYGVFKKERDAAKRFDEVCWNDLHDLSKLNFPNNYKNID